MAGSIGQHLFAGLGMEHDCQLIAHRAGRDKYGGILASYRSRLLLECVDRWIVVIDIITQRAIASNISAVGRVTVSDLKSATPSGKDIN